MRRVSRDRRQAICIRIKVYVFNVVIKLSVSGTSIPVIVRECSRVMRVVSGIFPALVMRGM